MTASPPAPAARRRRRSAAETQAEILTKAEELFRSAGYAKTSIADIAASLGMSPANVFKHFPSKMALGDAIGAIHLGLIEQALTAIPSSLPPAERLRRFGETLLAGHLRNMEGNPYVFDLVVQGLETEAEEIRAFHVWLNGAVRSIVEAGMADGSFAVADAETTARVVLNCLEGVTHPLLLRQLDQPALAQRLAEMLDFLIAALRKPLDK